MKTKFRQAAVALVAITLLATSAPAWAAINTATDPGGGGVSLTASGAVTVTSAALQLVKQVYDASGTCLASQPSDATCNGGITSIVVPAGSAIKFLIFVKNATDVALTDVRFEDVLDVTLSGFTFSAGTIKYNNAQADSATAAQIYTAVNTGTAQTDALGAPDDFAAYNSPTVNTLTVGKVTGQVNSQVDLAARKTFGIIFNAIKK